MSGEQSVSDQDIEKGKLFDTIRELKAIKEKYVSGEKAETLEVKDMQVDAESLADAMLAVHIARFKELFDMSVPVFAEFIGEIEQLPNIRKALSLHDQFEAEATG